MPNPTLLAAAAALTLLPLGDRAATPEGDAAAQWPTWRGPTQDGVSTATGVPTTWSPDENVIWKAELPSWSGATPILWGERIFVMSPSGSESGAAPEPESGRGRGGGRDPGGDALLLLCFSTKDGSLLWEQVVDEGNALYRKGNNTSCSPVTDGEHVWAVTGTGQITCYDMEGEDVWSRNLQKDFGKFGHNWGYACSPLLHDGKLIVEVLHGSHTDEPSYLAAFDAASGEKVWRVERLTDAPRESPDAYTTPLLVQHAGKTQIVVSGGDVVTGHDPATGKELWRVGGLNPAAAGNYRIVASPLYADGLVYAPTRVRPLTAIALGEKAMPTDESIAWQWNERAGPDVPTPTCDGKYFYMVNDSGLATCLDAKTGAVIWGPERTVQGTVSSSPILVDGKLYFTNEEAVTVVLAAGAKYELLATNELDGSYTLCSPIVSGDRMYLRTEEALYCLGAKE